MHKYPILFSCQKILSNGQNIARNKSQARKLHSSEQLTITNRPLSELSVSNTVTNIYHRASLEPETAIKWSHQMNNIPRHKFLCHRFARERCFFTKPFDIVNSCATACSFLPYYLFIIRTITILVQG